MHPGNKKKYKGMSSSDLAYDERIWSSPDATPVVTVRNWNLLGARRFRWGLLKYVRDAFAPASSSKTEYNLVGTGLRHIYTQLKQWQVDSWKRKRDAVVVTISDDVMQQYGFTVLVGILHTLIDRWCRI